MSKIIFLRKKCTVQFLKVTWLHRCMCSDIVFLYTSLCS